MRRWGYGLAGLLAIALFAGIASPEEPPVETQTTASGPQATQETSPPVASEEPTESTGPTADPEPSPTQTSTETSQPAPQQSAAQETTTEPTQAPEPTAVAAQEVESTPTPTPTPTSTPTPTPSPTPTQTAAAPAPQTSGLAGLLAQLEIEEEFPSGYDRDLFPHWIDADRDGCDARREVLIIEAVVAPVVGDRCSLTGGSWYSTFDGVTITNASQVDMDHMVPLKEAWDSGAHAWSEDRRRAFANDIDLPEALVGVTRSSNRSKGARDPAEWLPPLASYHCQYVRDWMVVKITWELSVDAREFNALRSVAAGC